MGDIKFLSPGCWLQLLVYLKCFGQNMFRLICFVLLQVLGNYKHTSLGLVCLCTSYMRTQDTLSCLK